VRNHIASRSTILHQHFDKIIGRHSLKARIGMSLLKRFGHLWASVIPLTFIP